MPVILDRVFNHVKMSSGLVPMLLSRLIASRKTAVVASRSYRLPGELADGQDGAGTARRCQHRRITPVVAQLGVGR